MKKTLSSLAQRLNLLERDYKLLKYNQGDQMREVFLVNESAHDTSIYNGHRIIPNPDVLLYINFIHDFDRIIYKSNMYHNEINQIDACCSKMDEYIGLQEMEFMEGKLIFYPGLKYVLQYAILYYIYCYVLNYEKTTIKLDFLNFMSDVFKLFSIITNNKAEYKECSGRSCFNLFDVKLKTLKKLQDVEKSTTDKINVNQFVDSIRYAAKRLFIGTVMNSYDNRRSELIEKMLYRPVKSTDETANISNNEIVYGYVNNKKQLMYRTGTEPNWIYYNTDDCNKKTFQPYYSMDEIITSTIQNNGIITMKTNGTSDPGLGNQYVLDSDSNSYNFHFGLFKEWDNSNYFTFQYSNNLDTSFSSIEQIDSNDNLDFLCGSGKKVDELMFDYYDEIDMVKVRRTLEKGWESFDSAKENSIAKYVSTTMRFETWGYANDNTSVYIQGNEGYEYSSGIKINLKFYYDPLESHWIDANNNVWAGNNDGNIIGTFDSKDTSLSITTVPGYLEVFEKAYLIDGKYILREDDDDYMELCQLWLKNIN